MDITSDSRCALLCAVAQCQHSSATVTLPHAVETAPQASTLHRHISIQCGYIPYASDSPPPLKAKALSCDAASAALMPPASIGATSMGLHCRCGVALSECKQAGVT